MSEQQSQAPVHSGSFSRVSASFLILLTVFTLAGVSASIPSAQATPINCLAHFRLYGEAMNINSLGYTSMDFSMMVNGQGVGSGSIATTANATSSSGCFSGISIPIPADRYYGVVDYTFSVPFTVEPNQPSSLALRTYSDAVRTVLRFSENGPQWWVSGYGTSILKRTQKLGLIMQSVTLADGSSLQDQGLRFEWIDPNLKYSVYLTGLNGDYDGIVDTSTTAPNDLFVGGNGAAASVSRDAGLIRLAFAPEPNSYVCDLAEVRVSGNSNFRIAAVPEPITAISFGLGSFFLIRADNRKVGR